MIQKNLISYEARNILGNWYIPFFGLVFPLLLFYLIGYSISSDDVSQTMQEYIKTTLFLTLIQIVPLSTVFLGHSSLYAIEIENKIPQRLALFGIPQKAQIIHRFLLLWFFSIMFSLVQMAIVCTFSHVSLPTMSGFVSFILIISLLSVSLFLFAHGIALYFARFGPAYGFTMMLYFLFMITGNLMGGNLDKMPTPILLAGKTLPFYYFSTEFIDVWRGHAPNLAPYIQSMLFFFLLSVVVLLIGIYLGKYRRA